MKLILTRHGKTIENEKGILQGHLDGTLSELGIEQAKRVAERLKDEKIDAIYSSDLKRAADTAREIGKFHPNIKIQFIKELRERNLGEFQGKSKKETGWDGLSTSMDPVAVKLKKVEPFEEMYDRAKKFLDQVLHKHKKDQVLVVTHDMLALFLIGVITHTKLQQIPTMEALKNTSISIFEIDEEKNHKVHLFNCTNHLI